MSNYNHGVRVNEKTTSLNAPIKLESGVQVVVGTAPVHLIKNYKDKVNKPILVSTYEEAVEILGYSDEWNKYTLCQSMYASFQLMEVSPIIFINVLDPDKNKKKLDSIEWNTGDGMYIFSNGDVILDSIIVKDGENVLEENKDYVITISDGLISLTMIAPGTGSTLTIEANAVEFGATDIANQIVGGYDAQSGKNTGISCIHDVYLMTEKVPGILLAPGYSQNEKVAAALQAACKSSDGDFVVNAVIDVDSSENGALKPEDFKQAKEKLNISDKNAVAVWPKIKINSKIYYYSAVYAALCQKMDANNDGVPTLSPSNKAIGISATVLENGEEIFVSKTSANNYINANGGVTAINYGGWKSWGNNTAAYPDVVDPKDRWICVRRFFNYYRARLIIKCCEKVDKLTDPRFVEAICDDENVWFNAMKGNLHIAGGNVSYKQEDNPIDNILAGKIKFRVKLATYTPAEDVAFDIELDPDILADALNGGNES